MQLFCLTQETKGKEKDEPGAALLTSACGGDPGYLRASGRLPLALHRGAMEGGQTTTSQASSTARGLTAATAGGVARGRVDEAWGVSGTAIRAGAISSITVGAGPPAAVVVLRATPRAATIFPKHPHIEGGVA